MAVWLFAGWTSSAAQPLNTGWPSRPPSSLPPAFWISSDTMRRSATRRPGRCPPFTRRSCRTPKQAPPAYRNIPNEDFDRCRRAAQRKRELVNQLHHDAVTMLLGTDTQQPFAAPGVALHREFDAFDQAGIPRRDSFRMATATAASVLGLSTVGTVAKG